MTKLKIDWQRVGPARPEAMPLPPVSMLLNGYVMDFDETVGEVVYLCGTGYDGFGEAWSWDGARFAQLQRQKVNLDGEGLYQGYYDPSRRGMVAFRFGYDYDSEQHRPAMILVSADGAREVKTGGEPPEAGEDHDLGGAFAYDRARDVGVCLTPQGVWELDAAGSWRKALDGGEGVIPQEWKDDCGGLWDPVRGQVFFWIYENDEYTHQFYGWDGAALTRLPDTGLPLHKKGLREFHIGLFNPSASFAGHPEHGVVLLDGAQLWAFDGARWADLPAPQSPPPRMQQGRLACDPGRGVLLLGPGFHDGDAGGRDAQQVYFELIGGGWTKLGVMAEDSPVEALYGKHRYFTCNSAPHVVPYRSLRTFAWQQEAWVELVDEKRGEKIVGSDNVGAVVGLGDHALAVLRKGAVCRFDGAGWKKTQETIPDFKERMDFTLTRVGDTERLVAWGGEVKNRKSNDSFFRAEDGGWRKNKKASPRPKDFGHKHGPYVDFDAFYDSALDRVVRIGLDEVFTLEGEVWQPHTPKGYAKLAGSRTSEHLPAHDPLTGETLLINLQRGRIVRFDLKRCQEVGAIGLPDDEIGPKEQHDTATWARLDDDLWFDAANRTLRAQYCADRWAQYAWDLRPAFEAAAKLGQRALLAPLTESSQQAPAKKAAKAGTKAPPKKTKKTKTNKKTAATEVVGETSARLYVIDGKARKLWYCDVEGAAVIRRWGRIGAKISDKKEKKASPAAARAAAAKLIAKKRAEGYVDAAELKLDAVASLAAVESRAIKVGKPSKKAPEDQAIARIGGLPSGVGAKAWPALDGDPMGFLFQVSTGDLLKKHAGVAVFCTTDGTATEDEAQNVALLLTKAAWNKKPLAAAPAGVPVLPVRRLTFAAPKLEILEERVQELATDDPELGACFDALQASAKVHDDVPWSKQGGPPAWVQDGESSDAWILAAQLDFDGLSLEGAWADAGLFGVIYVFVSADEKRAVAMWQYT